MLSLLVAKLAKSFGRRTMPKVLATFATGRTGKLYVDRARVDFYERAVGAPNRDVDLDSRATQNVVGQPDCQAAAAFRDLGGAIADGSRIASVSLSSSKNR